MNDPLDDLLDARLRESAPYIDDAGFTGRVMKQLPRRPASLQTQRSVIILVAALLSAVVAFFASGEGMFVRDLLAHANTLPMAQMFVIAAVCAMITTIGALWAGISSVRELKL